MAHTRDRTGLDLTRDCYWSIAAFPDDGHATRTLARAQEVRALVVDDVGSKVPEGAVRLALGDATAIVETSSDNFQWVYRLSAPVAVAEWDGTFAEVERLVGVALEGRDAVHLFRLPCGVNTKKGRGGFRVRLVELNPEIELSGLVPAAAHGQFTLAEEAPGPKIRNIGGLLQLIPNDLAVDRARWVDRAHQIKALAADEREGGRAFDAWSQTWPGVVDAAETARVWDSLPEVTRTSGRELLVAAEAADAVGFARLMNAEAGLVFDDNAVLARAPGVAGDVEFFVDQEKSSIEVVKHFAGRLRCVGRGDWREFDEGTGRWREWTGDHMLRRVLELVRARKGRALDPEVSKKLASVKFIEGIARAAALHVSVIAKVTDFDRVALLLGVPSGVIDLRPGASRQVRRGRVSEMVSKAMWVDPAPAGTGCPEWTRFLAEFTRGDASLAEWLQVRAGYCLTGLMDEYILPFYHGSGGNGKSVYLNALRSVWGEYGAQIEHRLLFEKTGGYHLAPLAVLAGVRLAIVTDVPQAASWDVHIMKMLTGDDAITANRMHQNPITFKSTAKVDVSGNGEPVVKDMDEGVRRRLKLIPLTSQPKVIDKQLSRKLLDEYGAILSWALAGLDKYWALGGLPISSTVDDATKEYHNMLDPFQRWLDIAVAEDRSQGAKLSASDMFRSWDTFRSGESRYGAAPVDAQRLVRKMRDKGFDFSSLNGRSILRGYKLNNIDFDSVF
jgi:putative DNA primase/helicase